MGQTGNTMTGLNTATQGQVGAMNANQRADEAKGAQMTQMLTAPFQMFKFGGAT